MYSNQFFIVIKYNAQYYCSYIFVQLNAAFVGIRDLRDKTILSESKKK